MNVINIKGKSQVHSNPINNGSFGTVFKYRSIEGSWKAVKCLEVTNEFSLEHQFMSALRECSFMKIASLIGCGPQR